MGRRGLKEERKTVNMLKAKKSDIEKRRRRRRCAEELKKRRLETSWREERGVN